MKNLLKSKSILNIQHNTKDEVDLKLPIKLTATVKRLNCTAWSKRWLWNESKNHFFKCVKCHIIYPIHKLFMLNKYNVKTKFHKQQTVTKELKLFFCYHMNLQQIQKVLGKLNRVLRMLCTFAEQSKHFPQRGGWGEADSIEKHFHDREPLN